MPTISRLRHNITFAHVVDGEKQDGKRLNCDCSVIEHLNKSGIVPEAVAIDADGCSFIIAGRDSKRFSGAVRDLNVTVKLRDGCARIALTRNSTDSPLPSLQRVMQAFVSAGITVVHLAADPAAVTVVTDEADVDSVARVFLGLYQPA